MRIANPHLDELSARTRENVSLLGVQRMLSDGRYRAWVVKQIKDPMVRSFWINEFAQYNSHYQQEVVGPIQNKIGQIFMSPALRNVLGQVGTKINFRWAAWPVSDVRDLPVVDTLA